MQEAVEWLGASQPAPSPRSAGAWRGPAPEAAESSESSEASELMAEVATREESIEGMNRRKE